MRQLEDPVKSTLEKIKEDRISGAREIVQAAGDLILLYLKNPPSLAEQLSRDIAHLLKSLIETFPAMAPLRQINEHLTKCLQAQKNQTSQELAKTLIQWIQSWKYERSHAFTHLLESALSFFHHGGTILTHSRSSTVEAVFLALHQKNIPIRVLVTESTPGSEGMEVLKRLELAGINVQLIPDSSVEQALDDCQFALVGADAITKTFFVNKIGTARLSKLAKKKGVPLVVTADKDKNLSHPQNYEYDQNIFEETPMSLVHHLITD